MVENWVIEKVILTSNTDVLNFLLLIFSDQFVLQPDGYGRIVGRLKEMIIRGGENIFPKEIEDFLNAHEDILETHVCRN